MVKTAIYGFGNIGKFVYDAILESSDIELCGIISSSLEPGCLGDVKIVRNIDELPGVEVAILCAPSRAVPELAASLLEKGICTVDSFDIHTEIAALREKLDPIAKKSGKAAIISAGWDPGSDSVIRALMEAMAPNGITYTNFGPGMSMGHSVAAKSIAGVKDALSMTIPCGTSVHRRMVYIELENGADFKAVEKVILSDDYFAHDDTHVFAVPSVDALKDMGHGVNLTRKGVSGKTHNQNFSFEMSINNPALTAQILVSSARAAAKIAPGCYTMIEIAPIDYLPGDREEIIKRLV